jgi:general stress protein 26
MMAIRVARFFLVQHTKTGKIYHITIKHTEWTQNLPNGHKIYQHLSLQDPTKFTQIGIFGLKICRLETLMAIGQGSML